MSEEYVTHDDLNDAVTSAVNDAMNTPQPVPRTAEAPTDQTLEVPSEPYLGAIPETPLDYPVDDNGYLIVPDAEFWSVTEIRDAWYPGYEGSRGGKLPNVFGWLSRAGIELSEFSPLGDPTDREAGQGSSIRGLLNVDYARLRAFKLDTERLQAERLEDERTDPC